MDKKNKFISIPNPMRDETFGSRGADFISESSKEKIIDIGKVSPHLRRHSFALAYIENGGDPFSLQRILGRTDHTTTAKYANIARSNVKTQHGKYSLGERVG